MSTNKITETELHIQSNSGETIVSLKGGDKFVIHDDPKKIHQLLDLLELPEGTEVNIITTASSVIVR